MLASTWSGCEISANRDLSDTNEKSNMISILPLGDSITAGDLQHRSYRQPLLSKLVSLGYSVEFIGTQRASLWSRLFSGAVDNDHEGHWGWETGNIARHLSDWLEQVPVPDVALIHLGSNDVFRMVPSERSLINIDSIVKQLKSVNPAVQIFIAKIIPAEEAEHDCAKFNQVLSEYIESLNDPRIVLVDMFSGFDAKKLTYDGVHPNLRGGEWMAERWLSQLVPFLNNAKN